MTLREANNKLEQLNNDYNYWLREKEIAQSLVLPQSTDTTAERIEGGKRVDKMLKYVEIIEDKQIDETLEYIHQKKLNVLNWIDNELKRLGKHGETEKIIVQLKENTTVIDKNTEKERFLTWEEIGLRAHFDKDYCRKVYRLYKKKRDIDPPMPT